MISMETNSCDDRSANYTLIQVNFGKFLSLLKPDFVDASTGQFQSKIFRRATLIDSLTVGSLCCTGPVSQRADQ